MHEFFDEAARVLALITGTQQENIQRAVDLVADSLLAGGVWHVFGTGHSHCIAEELYYRAGGLAPVNAILYPPLMQHEGPVTATSLERTRGLAAIVLGQQDIRPGEVLTIVSNSGKNAVPVEMALLAHERGFKTIAITSLAQSRAAMAHPELGKKLYEICDVVIDNCGNVGDATLTIPGTELTTSATSGISGAAIAEQIVYGVACRFAAAGREAPIFKTANLPGGDEWNKRLIEQCGGRVNLR